MCKSENIRKVSWRVEFSSHQALGASIWRKKKKKKKEKEEEWRISCSLLLNWVSFFGTCPFLRKKRKIVQVFFLGLGFFLEKKQKIVQVFFLGLVFFWGETMKKCKVFFWDLSFFWGGGNNGKMQSLFSGTCSLLTFFLF